MALGAIGCAVDSLSGPAPSRSTLIARAIALVPRDTSTEGDTFSKLPGGANRAKSAQSMLAPASGPECEHWPAKIGRYFV